VSFRLFKLALEGDKNDGHAEPCYGIGGLVKAGMQARGNTSCPSP